MTYQNRGEQNANHQIDPNKLKIVAVKKDGRNIQAVKFQNGEVADIQQAIQMAEQDLIEDVNTGSTRDGGKTLRSYPDGDPTNNLDNLPTF
ncbi:hypothetical protein D3C87_76640 [compost metagenome]